MFKYLVIGLFLITVLVLVFKGVFLKTLEPYQTGENTNASAPSITTPPSLKNKILSNNYHIFQTFNNCGPAALSMALSYYGIHKSQEESGQELRPYQNPQGDNDDKSVTLEELGQKVEEYNLISFHRPNGNMEIIKNFINHDIPVITRTWTKENEDIGHFRVIKGYDDTTQELIQDDSLQGKNLKYSYQEFEKLWSKFNYEYLVLIPKDKEKIALTILGEDKDPHIAWKKAMLNSQKELENDPENVYSRFNLSVALYHIGEYEKAVEEFEKVQNLLPIRTLWYQIEPIEAYFKLDDYQKVISITEKILKNYNRAFSELYFLRAQVYEKQGNKQAAQEEYEKAVFYNRNFASKVPPKQLVF